MQRFPLPRVWEVACSAALDVVREFDAVQANWQGKRTGRGRADCIERRSAGVVRTGLTSYSAQGAGYKRALGCDAAVAASDCLAFGQVNKVFQLKLPV